MYLALYSNQNIDSKSKILAVELYNLTAKRMVFVKNNEKQRRLVRRLVTFGLSIIIYAVLLTMLVQLESAGEDSNIHNFPDAIWYSLVTLTTVGYGDISPALPIAQFFVFMESIIGSFYLAIMVASLVSIRLAQSQSD